MSFIFWNFCGLIYFAFLMRFKRHALEAGPLPLILFNMPSTIIHELMHYIVGFITGGRPHGFSIFPHKELYLTADGKERHLWTLGSINFIPTTRSAFPTATAPLLMLPGAFILYAKWFSWFEFGATSTFILYSLIFILVSGAIPSRQDIKVAFSSPASIILTLVMTTIAVATIGYLSHSVPAVQLAIYKIMVFIYS